MKKFWALSVLVLFLFCQNAYGQEKTHSDLFYELYNRRMKQNIDDELLDEMRKGNISPVEFDYIREAADEKLKKTGDDYLKCVVWQETSENFDRALVGRYADAMLEFNNFWRASDHTVSNLKKQLKHLVKRYDLTRNKISLD